MAVFKRSYLLYLLTRNSHQGFTVWELLLLIPTIGILGVITFSIFIGGCGTRPVQAEGRSYISTMNRAQQAYFLEKNTFASSISDLQISIKTQTKFYNYSARRVNNQAVFNYAIARQEYVDRGWFDKRPTKSYVGVVFTAPVPKNSQSQDKILTLAIACEANSPTTKQPSDPVYKNGAFTCAEGTTSLAG